MGHCSYIGFACCIGYMVYSMQWKCIGYLPLFSPLTYSESARPNFHSIFPSFALAESNLSGHSIEDLYV